MTVRRTADGSQSRVVRIEDDSGGDRERILARFRQEPRDETWAVATERALTDGFSAWAARSVPTLGEVRCAHGRCRVEVRTQGEIGVFSIEGPLTFDGCRTEELETPRGDERQVFGIDCAWPSESEATTPTVAAIRCRWEEAIATQRERYRFQFAECRRENCVVQIDCEDGEGLDEYAVRSLDGLGGCHAHGRAAGLVLLSCAH